MIFSYFFIILLTSNFFVIDLLDFVFLIFILFNLFAIYFLLENFNKKLLFVFFKISVDAQDYQNK